MNWRLKLALVAGAALAFLPLSQGWWLDALWVLLGAAVVIGSWSLGAGVSPRAGLVVGAGLVALLAVLWWWSQWPRGPLRPPPADWLLAWVLIGGLISVTALAVARASGSQPTERWQFRCAIALPLIAVCLMGCGIGFTMWDRDGELRFCPREDELLPLPSTLRLVSADPPHFAGSAGVCSRQFAVASSEGKPREVVVAQLVDHLRDRGWDLQSGRSSYYAFRDVGGFIHWTGHQVWLSTNPDPHPVPPEAVAVDVGN